jgi:16S rRNA A1518/A1519 N6-dimethyltransferase RsmA/KsgA/DIM1 with predicted DNA glycosylase/AP lyase activity
MAQTFCNVRMLERISSSKFTPRPKVDAGLVHFQFKPEMRAAHIFDRLEAFTARHFRHKNQTAFALDGQRPLHIAPGEFLRKCREEEE